MLGFNATAAPMVRSGLCLTLGLVAAVAASGCGLLTPANYIAQPRIVESKTPVCYRHASRIVMRCDHVEYRRDEDVRALLSSTQPTSDWIFDGVR